MKNSKVKQLVEDGWIHAKMIMEIAGRPEEHVNNTLKEIGNKFEKEKLKIISLTLHRAKDVGEGIFSGFAEADFLTAKMSTLFGFVYDYMPSSLEIVSPDNLTETTANISNILNDLIAKLHQYDNAFKNLYTKNLILNNKLASASGKKDSKKK